MMNCNNFKFTLFLIANMCKMYDIQILIYQFADIADRSVLACRYALILILFFMLEKMLGLVL